MQKKVICSMFVCLLLVSGAGAQYDSYDSLPHCQILDEPTDPMYRIDLSFLPEERFEGYGRSSLIEVGADWELAYLYDILWGDIDLKTRLRATLLMDSAGLQLPNQVTEISIDAGWTTRTMGGTAFQARIRPGLYSDIEEISAEVVYFPFSLALIQSFNDQLSGIAGLDVRMGFDRVFIPLMGLAWQPADNLRMHIGIPESKVELYLDRLWSVHGGFEWMNTTYDLREEGGLDRGQMTLEDYRLYGGFTRGIAGNVKFAFDLGYVLERSVEFERAAEGYARDVDIENGMFIRCAVVGPF